MKAPPLSNIEIEVPGNDRELQTKQLTTSAANSKPNNDDSISSELSIDLLTKEQGSSGSCRWNPDDSDYSLNVLLAPRRTTDEERASAEHDADEKQETATTSTASSFTGSSNSAANDSLSTTSTHSLFGSDYSLNRMRIRVRPSHHRNKNNLMLDASSHHSTLSVDTLDTESSVRSKLPENIEVAPQSKPKAIRKSSVSFFPRVRIQRVLPRKMIPPEQLEAVWYSRDEFQVIRKECFKTIGLMKDDEDATDEDRPLFDEDGVELCRRGLEYKTPKAYKRRQKQKKDVRMVVFEELDFQEEQGMDDPMWLAKLSRDQSRSCVEAAIEAAREDERQARLFLGSFRRCR